MNAFYDLMVFILENLYTPILAGLQALPLMGVEIAIGLSILSIAEVVAGALTLLLFLYAIYLPVGLVRKGLRKLWL
jgi:hypothetical protein